MENESISDIPEITPEEALYLGTDVNNTLTAIETMNEETVSVTPASVRVIDFINLFPNMNCRIDIYESHGHRLPSLLYTGTMDTYYDLDSEQIVGSYTKDQLDRIEIMHVDLDTSQVRPTYLTIVV